MCLETQECKKLLVFAILAILSALAISCGEKQPPTKLIFSEESSAVPLDESIYYNRILTWRPADGKTVKLNPPRFCWPYEPTIMLPEGVEKDHLPLRLYSFQVADNESFDNPLVDVPETPFNFYNTLQSFPSGAPVYWRVGYHDPDDVTSVEWSAPRQFTIAGDAVVWDRLALKEPEFNSAGHPRIIFNRDNLDNLRNLYMSNEHSKVIYDGILSRAENDLHADWFVDFPADDLRPDTMMRKIYSDIPPHLDPDGSDDPYLIMIDRLMDMAFAWMLTGDNRFLAVVPHMTTVATWRDQGATSPEGLGGSPDNVSLNEYLSLIYDWFYDELTAVQKEKILAGLRWRTDHILYNYSWRSKHGAEMNPNSVAIASSSHPYENINYAFIAGIAAYEDDELFKTMYDMAVNYLSGVNNPFGPVDSWNEGPGYGLSKFKWMMNQVSYFDMTLKDAGFGKNPFLNEIGEFFTRVAVMGLPHLSFGNIGIMEPYYLNNRISSFRKLAYLTGRKDFLDNWKDTLRRLEQIGYSTHRQFMRPWIEYSLPYFYAEPARVQDQIKTHFFPDGGWVTSSNLYPGYLDNYKDNLGIVFHARPRGAYNHSFFGDNNFQIYAYGQNITHAGGSTQNKDRYAYHSMAQNVVLVDGLGQAQPNHTRMNNFNLGLFDPYAARVARFGEKDNTVYFMGEAAKSYVQYPYHYRDFWGFLGDGENNPYDERDLSYVTRADRHVLFVDGRYFVMLDNLEVGQEQGSRFSWLYHVLQDVPLEWNGETQIFNYSIDGVNTLVKVIGSQEICFSDRRNDEGLINPLSGEDYRPYVQRIKRYDNNWNSPYPEMVTHNIWIENSEPARGMKFLAVIYPYRDGATEPSIENIDSLTVRVECGDRSEIITFDPENNPEADIQVKL